MNEGQTVESETTPPICAQCGSPLDSNIGGDEICSNCLLRLALDQDDDDPGKASPRSNQLIPGNDRASIERMFGRYTLIKILGQGGMGVVWLARDEELEREVALKFLPDLMIQDRAVIDRLKRETKRCLELTHPHIVRIHDFVHDGRSGCISMEYVDGDTLAGLRCQKERKVFEPSELSSWIGQLCEALDYAHNRARIMHRDLKPANLMVNQRGDLKVSDFGIARSLGDSMSMLTREQGRSGTLVYMSPQQLEGERGTHLDDIYSLGATLYDLLTSKPPFYSGNIDRQVHERVPPSMTERRKDLNIEPASMPPIWEEVVAACLQKDPAKRPQSAVEVANRLQLSSAPIRIRMLPPTPPDPLGRKTLAVLPIEDLHPDPENSWFADGLTQELINVLSQIERLRVRDRKSVKNYDMTGKSAERMADELGVQYLLEGTVRILKEQMRITVELIDAVTGDHLWSQTFKGTMEDIFKIQEQVALEIAEALKIKLTLEERSSVGQRMTVNMEAYERFVRAEEAMINQSPAAYQRAEYLLKQAVVLDPAFANAWALLAGIHNDSYWLYTRDEELLKSAETEARTALLHDQDSALAHVQLGLVAARRGDRAEALKMAHEALRLSPNDGVIQLWRGHVYVALGDIDRSIETWEYAARLSPDNLMVLWALAFQYALWNEHKHLHAHAVRSLPFLERYVFLHPDDRSIRGEYIVSLAATGRVEEACRIAQNLLAEPSDEAVHLAGIATTFLLAGDVEQAIAVCERLSDLGAALYVFLTPLFRKLRHHPKYRDLLKTARKNFCATHVPVRLQG